MTVPTNAAARRTLAVMARIQAELTDPRSYGRIAYLLVALPLGVAEFSLLVTAISFGIGTAVTLIGLPVLVATLFAWRWLAEIERAVARVLAGTDIPSPYRPEPEGAGWSARVAARLADPATWKDLAFLLLVRLPLGIASFTIAVTVFGAGLGLLGAPAWYWAVDEGIELGLLQADTLAEALAVVPLGALVLVLGVPALSALGRLYARIAAALLGSSADPVLTAKVTQLQDARSRIIAAADAERRRIERDLHDGAQQRLVALSLNLRMAEARASKGDPEAAGLIRQAGEEASLALTELRDLARGIHPAILTNRGLAAALDDVASRSPVPVEIRALPDERLPEAVEAAAYFVASECLANVAKHARATRATVEVLRDGARVRVVIEDDGVGGASLGSGSGLQGLEDRVGALDGQLEVHSPPGGGTRVTATLALAPRGLDDRPSAELIRGVVADDELHAVLAHRRRALRRHAIAFGAVAAVILIVWTATGAPNAWPVWPLLGLALVGGLDAWFSLAGAPLAETAASAEALRRRNLRLQAGAYAILNLVLVGIWAAAGGGYFWPVWSILGCGVALVIKTLRPRRFA